MMTGPDYIKEEKRYLLDICAVMTINPDNANK